MLKKHLVLLMSSTISTAYLSDHIINISSANSICAMAAYTEMCIETCCNDFEGFIATAIVFPLQCIITILLSFM